MEKLLAALAVRPGCSRIWRVYVIPTAVFQSVMIGGGYGTGREIVEYFTQYGIGGGLLGLGLVTMCFAILLALSFEFARVYRAYDYRSFFRALLGRGWWSFEVLYLAMFAIVLAVIAAASGRLFEEQLQIPKLVGVSSLLGVVAVLAFYGRQWVTRILALKAALLSAVFLAYFIAIVRSATPQILSEVSRFGVSPGWVEGALRYALYSSVVIPAMLFATRDFASRSEAFLAGLLGAIGGMLPGVLLHISFAAGYPEVLKQTLPAYWMISGLAIKALTAAYIAVLFGCLLDTGLCFIQSVNERLDGWRRDTGRVPLSRAFRAAVAAVAILLSASLSFVGVVPLISKGYGAMAWGFLVLFVGPLLTVGVYRLILRPAASCDEGIEHNPLPGQRE
jgi:uncharacterized membrane protein YkvI